MTDKFFDDKNSRKNKIHYDRLDKHKKQDEETKIKHKQNIEHKKQKQEIEENEWEYWKHFYK